LIDQLLIIIGVTVLVAVTPGPDMVIVMRNTVAGGRSAGLQTSLGVLSGNLVHIGYCVVGIGWLISTSIVAFSILKFAGAAYLIYLGIMSFRAKEISLGISQTPSSTPNRTWFLQGFINNVLNPKGALFFLGVFTMVITPDTSIVTTILLIGVMIVICAAFWLFFVSTLDHPSVRQFIERFQQAASKVFGTLLVALGLRVALLER
jgi:RhtB (resistance to homoserine/threonine) family protein